MVDYSGQRRQRSKWFQFVEDVEAVIFVVSLACYDLYMDDNMSLNQMDDSISCFNECINHTAMLQKTIILFLNKIDIFRTKCIRSPVKSFFPEFHGPESDYDAAAAFFSEKFKSINKNPQRDFYVHITHATDRKQADFLLTSVMDSLFCNALNSI